MTEPGPQPRGFVGKRQAVVRGAIVLFARDGYTRASMDAIAAEAHVSTRTIYNHFHDKAELFQAVIQESATEVANAQIAILDRYLDKIVDLEDDLVEFGRVWSVPMTGYADHFAMVRQVAAEAGHIPRAAIDAWLEAGPLRVRRELALRMWRLSQAGWLQINDPDRAAAHFVLLTAEAVANASYQGAIPLSTDDISAIVTDGVRAFLRGYLPRREIPSPPARSIRIGAAASADGPAPEPVRRDAATG